MLLGILASLLARCIAPSALPWRVLNRGYVLPRLLRAPLLLSLNLYPVGGVCKVLFTNIS